MSKIYLEWEGKACRICMDEEGEYYAEMYFPGHGFQPTSLLDVLMKGTALSPQEFGEIIKRNSLHG